MSDTQTNQTNETTAPQTERPAEGTPAPDFALATHTGNQPVRLSDFKGDKMVVLYFYPKDDTPGCTTESCNFRDMSADFDEAGAIILGVSLDDVSSHQAFADKFKLPFPLLADTDASVSTAYGVYKEKNMYGRKSLGIERTTFIIGRDGNIAKVYPRVKVDQHADEVLSFVREHGS
jgi:peroxiredoxin Q/BCP